MEAILDKYTNIHVIESKEIELKELRFENRAWEKADSPRLHAQELLVFIEGGCAEAVHLYVQWHHGANQWCLSEETEYSSNTPLGRPMCYGKASFFSTLSYLKEFIREKYSREPVFPPFQFKIKKEK